MHYQIQAPPCPVSVEESLSETGCEFSGLELLATRARSTERHHFPGLAQEELRFLAALVETCTQPLWEGRIDCDGQNKPDKQQILWLFGKADHHDSNHINYRQLAEMAAAAGIVATVEELSSLLRDGDTQGNDAIDVDTFVMLMDRHPEIMRSFNIIFNMAKFQARKQVGNRRNAKIDQKMAAQSAHGHNALQPQFARRRRSKEILSTLCYQIDQRVTAQTAKGNIALPAQFSWRRRSKEALSTLGC